MNGLLRRSQLIAALFAVFVLLATEVSFAGVFGTITKMRDPAIGVPFTNPDSALPASWVSYAFGLQTTQGELIAGIEFTLNHPQLHQRWTDIEFDGPPFEPTPNSTNVSNGDSHLRTPVFALFASGPTENNSGVGSPLPDTDRSDYGLGTTLQGEWGIPSGQTTTASLAYIVIPKGTEQLLDLSAVVYDPNGELIGNVSIFDFGFGSPSLQVTGNGLVINRGDNSPRTEDNTDFGFGPLGEFERRTFRLENTGTNPVSLGPPAFTGPFALEGDEFPATINPFGSATFNVLVNRTMPGVSLGSIAFGSNSGAYSFALAAHAVPEPTCALSGGMMILMLAACPRRCRENC